MKRTREEENMALSNVDIIEAIKKKEIVIENFSEECLQPASYDMRMGKEAVKKAGKINVEEKGLVLLEPGDIAILGTYEAISLSNRYAGHIGIRSHYTRKGLVLLAGPQIDPGFSGILTVAVCNLGPGTIAIPFMERLVTIEFFRLVKAASKPYSGPFQGQRTIPSDDIEFILTAKGITISDVIKELSTLSRNVAELTGTINTMKWMVPMLAGVIAGLLSILGTLIQYFFR
jgi:dCTP deaminase